MKTRQWILTSAVALSLTLGACTGAKQRKAEHMEKGLAHLQANNLDKARVEFSNVLQIDRKDKEAHYQLGVVLERQQNIREALSHYLATIQLDEKHVPARVRAGTVYLLAGALDQATEQADTLIKLDPANPDVLALHSGVRSQKGDLVGAEADVDALVKADPDNVAGFGLRAGLLERKGKLSEAMDVLREGINKHPDSLPLRYGLLKLSVQTKNEAQQLEVLEGIVAAAPDQVQPRMLLADYHTRKGELDKAEKVLRDTLALKQDGPEAKIALVQFLNKFRTTAQAESELQSMIKVQPEVYPLKFTLAQVYEQNKKPDQAEATYKDIIAQAKLTPPGLEARTKLAAHALGRKNIEEAEHLLAEVLKENAQDAAALTLHGRLALSKKDFTTAINDFRSGLHANPTSIELTRLLASAHVGNGEPKLAEELLQRTVEGNPKSVDARLDLARYYAMQKNPQAAIAKIKEALQIKPNELQLMTTLYQLQMDAGDLKGAQETTEAVLKAFPDLPAGHQLLGMVHMAQKDFAGGADAFDAALEKSPNAVDSLIQLVNSLQAQGKTAEALQRIDALLKSNPKNFVAQQLKAEIAVTQKHPEVAEAAFKQAMEWAPQWPIPYRGLAQLYFERKDYKKAVDTLKSGIAATKNAVPLVSSLALVYEKTGAVDGAIALYEEILQREPGSLFAANNLAALLADHRTDSANLERAAKLTETLDVEKNPIVADTVGWVQYRRGQVEQAVASLSKAAASAPDVGVIRYHLGMALAAKGDNDQARVELEKALAAKQPFSEIEAAKSALQKLRGGG